MSKPSSSASDPIGVGVSRRTFLGTTASGAALPLAAAAFGTRAEAQTETVERSARDPIDVTFSVNRQTQRLRIDPRTSLLDTLRDHIGLTGPKKGCDHGQCGACTVLVDGKRELSCMSFGIMHEGHEITTIEGLAAPGGNLHPVQQAFLDHDGFQCGYCTPGQIMSAVACIIEGHAETDADIREFMSGNLCRCAAYPNIVAAIRQARTEIKGA